MKSVLIFGLLLISLQASTQTPFAPDSLKICSIIDDWNKGWQTKDHVLATKSYSMESYFTNAFGDKRYGQTEVAALLKEVFALPFVMAGNSETSEHSYQKLGESAVVVHSAVVRKGQQLPDGTVLPDRQTSHMRVFQKTGDKWEIKAHLISDARDKQIPKH